MTHGTVSFGHHVSCSCEYHKHWYKPESYLPICASFNVQSSLSWFKSQLKLCSNGLQHESGPHTWATYICAHIYTKSCYMRLHQTFKVFGMRSTYILHWDATSKIVSANIILLQPLLYFIFIQQHVWYTVLDGEFPTRFRADKKTFHYLNLCEDISNSVLLLVSAGADFKQIIRSFTEICFMLY